MGEADGGMGRGGGGPPMVWSILDLVGPIKSGPAGLGLTWPGLLNDVFV